MLLITRCKQSLYLHTYRATMETAIACCIESPPAAATHTAGLIVSPVSLLYYHQQKIKEPTSSNIALVASVKAKSLLLHRTWLY